MDKDKLNLLIEKMQKKSGVPKPTEEISTPIVQIPKKEDVSESVAEVEEEDVEEYDEDLDDDSDLDSDDKIQEKIQKLQNKQKEMKKIREIPKETIKEPQKSDEREEIKINPLVDEGIFRTEFLLALNFHNKQLFRIANSLESFFGDGKQKDTN